MKIKPEELSSLLLSKIGREIEPATSGMIAREISRKRNENDIESISECIFWEKTPQNYYLYVETTHRHYSIFMSEYGYGFDYKVFPKTWYVVTSNEIPKHFLHDNSTELLDNLFSVPWIFNKTLPSAKYIEIKPEKEFTRASKNGNYLVLKLKNIHENTENFSMYISTLYNDYFTNVFVTTADYDNGLITLDELLEYFYKSLCIFEKTLNINTIRRFKVERFKKLLYSPNDPELQDILLKIKLENL